MTAARRAILETIVLASLGLAAAFAEHSRGGIELRLVALAIFLAVPTFRRLLVVLGRSTPAAPGWFALEVAAALLATVLYPVSLAALGLASVSLLAGAVPRSHESPRATLLEELGVAAVGFAATLIAFLALRREPDGFAWGFGVVALLVEAWGPGAARTRAHAARRLARFALVAGWCLAKLRHSDSWFFPHPEREVPLVAGGLALLEWTDLGAPALARASERTVTLLRRATWAAAGLAVALLVLQSLLPGPVERHVLAPERLRGAAVQHQLSQVTALEVTDEYELLEDGVPLPIPDSYERDVVAQGHGRYRVTGARRVIWSSRDGTDPLANGRRYELVVRPSVALSPLARVLYLVAGALALVAWRVGAIDPTRPASRRARLAFVGLVALALAGGLARGWDEVYFEADTQSYVDSYPVRTPLYPVFLDVLDRTPDAPSTLTPGTETRPEKRPGDRFVNAVRVQKVLLVLSLLAVAWAFTEAVSPWVVAALLALGALTDLVPRRLDVVTSACSSVMSEGLNHPLIFFLVAALFAYLVRATWPRALALALVLSLLLINRPANAALVAVLGVVWLEDLRRLGWKRASARTVAMVTALAVPIAATCAWNAQRTGHWKLHAFSGWNVLCPAIQVATEDDVEAFRDDPKLAELVRICVVENGGKRLSYDDPAAPNAVNVNLYEIAVPAFNRVYPDVPRDAQLSWVADEVFGKVAKRLLRRHPLGLLRFVWFNLEYFLRAFYLKAVTVLALAVSLVLFARSRAPLLLYAVFLATIPLVAILPACLVQFPLDRYHSQFAFAEVLTAPFLLATLLALGRKAGS